VKAQIIFSAGLFFLFGCAKNDGKGIAKQGGICPKPIAERSLQI
jgi:hypothetical protein